MRQRYWEIDAFRGIAIIAMVVFHFLFDLNYFRGYSFDLYSGVFWAIGRFAGVSFLLLVGIGLAISYWRTKEKETKLFPKYFFRGAKIFSYGLLITLATFLFVPQGTIVFGILHLIGVSVILAFPFVERKNLALIFGIIFFISGLYLQQFSFDFPWLLWLGFYPKGFYTFDYYPLLPWFGIVLFGVFLGNTIYSKAKQKFKLMDFSRFFPINVLCFLGKHSLPIYLLHQLLLVPTILLFF